MRRTRSADGATGQPWSMTAGEQLVADVASPASLVLSNVGLIEDLRASRQRLVAAQDEARRRLERNIHDGAQQDLVALAIKLRIAATTVDDDPAQAKELIGELQTDTSATLENLRDLARGIYPPLLADLGLVAALNAQASKSPVPVTVEADGIGRFGQDTEAAVFLLPRGAAEHRQVRPGHRAAHLPATGQWVNPVFHRGRRRGGLRRPAYTDGLRPAELADQSGTRRPARRPVGPQPGHDDHRAPPRAGRELGRPTLRTYV